MERVYVITAVPHPTPVTSPTVGITGATAVLLLLHEPPGVASVSVLDPPRQKLVVPVMAAGFGYTNTVIVVRQPVARV